MAMLDSEHIRSDKPAAAPGLIERLSDQLNKQEVLVSELESKLDGVSDRMPRENDDREVSLHLGSLVNYLERNNEKIRQLLSELSL